MTPSASSPSTASAMSPAKKFNTLHALAGRSSGTSGAAADGEKSGRTGIRGFFDAGPSSNEAIASPGGVSTPTSPSRKHASKEQSRPPNAASKWLSPGSSPAGGREDGPWSVSVAEASKSTRTSRAGSEKREGRKKSKAGASPMYTLYVTTPTHNLTLTRSSNDINELDSRLRDSHGSAAQSLPALPALPVGPVLPTSRKILQTISRTLSPGGHRNRAALNTLTSAGMNSVEGLPPTSSTAKFMGTASTDNVSSPAASTPDKEKTDGSSTTTQSTTSQLAMYFTTLSNIASVKKHKAWQRFLRVGADDLESVRVERRVRKVRSDLAQHVKTSVAPANTNVAITPSQSDIGEDGGRTDDERSISGRSTSHSYRQDENASRGASVDDTADRSARNSAIIGGNTGTDERDSTSRKPSGFAGIPEEMERGPSSEGERPKGAQADAPVTKKASTKRRERKARRQTESEKVTVDDFDMIRVLGKGCAGKVLLVRHKPSKGLFAMKSIHKRHVLAHQELQHTLTEQAVLKRMAREVMDPFVVKLWWSFHDATNLYLVMDFHPGGDLATQLSRWGRLGRDRARFYAAEIIEGVEGLHKAGVIYRDLKPENVLIGVDGHIVLSDFGLSKEFPQRESVTNTAGGSSTPPPNSPSMEQGRRKEGPGRSTSAQWGSSSEMASGNRSSGADTSNRRRWAEERDVTSTFCGTAEYLAPEVIQGAAYSYEVDWWSFGTMLYEMLTGITPFWADTHADMYVRVLHDELTFPEDRVLDQDTKSILRGLLQRNPMLRMKEPRIKRHPYFSMIEWDHVFHKRYIPPYIPPTNPLDETDTQNFDETFLDMKPVVDADDDDEDDEMTNNTTNGDGKGGNASQAAQKGTKSKSKKGEGKNSSKEPTPAEEVDAIMAKRAAGDDKSLFDGYSFRGRLDSESAHSTALSTSVPSETAAEAPPAVSADTSMTNTGSATPPTTIAAKSAPAKPVVYKPPASTVEDEDDDSAARAAVAALDQLEREAALDETAGSPTEQDDASKAGEAATAKNKSDSPTQIVRPKAVRKVSGNALAQDKTEDEEWDLVDVPTGYEPVMSETNGGKGQNLFSRGVVDTYRLLRRQESTRLPGVTPYTTKPFTRLSRRNLRNPKSGTALGKNAAASNSAVDSTSSMPANGSALSLSAKSVSEAPSEKALTVPAEEPVVEGADKPTGTSVSTPSSPAANGADDKAAEPASPHPPSARMKKMKRFTNFFESTTR